jgi:hypothetical protein
MPQFPLGVRGKVVQTPLNSAGHSQYERQKLNESLPRTRQIPVAAGMRRKCHGEARIVAHFRRTPRSKADHRFDAMGQTQRANAKGMGFRMTSIAAELAKKTGQKTNARKNLGEMLDQHYQQIGIQAVVAAARYHGANPADAPVSAQWYGRGKIA